MKLICSDFTDWSRFSSHVYGLTLSRLKYGRSYSSLMGYLLALSKYK